MCIALLRELTPYSLKAVLWVNGAHSPDKLSLREYLRTTVSYENIKCGNVQNRTVMPLILKNFDFRSQFRLAGISLSRSERRRDSNPCPSRHEAQRQPVRFFPPSC